MSDNINGFPVPEKPETREEQYLSAIAQVTPATQIPPKPLTRVEAYLNKIVENGTGGGGGGTTNYNALENKPQINSHELSGNKSSSDLGLQAALTEAQQAAVDSGIDSTKVQQIETNKTNILLKANTSDVNTATANLQGQIDQIAQAAGTGSADTEVAQARVGADGTSYNTLKERLDTEMTWLSGNVSKIALDEVGYISTSGDTANLTPVYNTAYRCKVVECEAGDMFTVHSQSGPGSLPYAFINSENEFILKSSTANVSYAYITAPANAVKAIFNTGYLSRAKISHGWVDTNTVFKQLDSRIATNTAAFESCENHIDTVDDTIRNDVFLRHIENNLTSDGIGNLKECEITLDGVTSPDNYGKSGAVYRIPIPDFKKVHIYIEWQWREAYPFESTTTKHRIAGIFNGAIAGESYVRNSNVYASSIYRTRLMNASAANVGAYSVNFQPNYAKTDNGKPALSIRYTGGRSSADDYAECIWTDSSVEFKIHSTSETVGTVEFTQNESLYSLVNKLNAVEGITCVPVEIAGHTCGELLPVLCPNTFSMDGTYINGNNETVYDNCFLNVPYAYDDSWHTLEIIADFDDLEGYVAFDGITQKVSISPNVKNVAVNHKKLVIGEGHFNVRNLIFDYGDYGDAEIVESIAYPYTAQNQMISDHNPRLIIFEGHGVDNEMEEDADHSPENMSASTDRLQYIFATLEKRGYKPVTWQQIIDWKVNNAPLPKRCFNLMMDDYYVDNYIDYNKRIPFEKYNIKAGLAIISDEYSMDDTLTINGKSYTIAEIMRLITLAGWHPCSHTSKHYILGQKSPSEIEDIIKESVLSCNDHDIYSDILVFPTGSTGNFAISALERSPFKLGINIVANRYNCRATRNHNLCRVDIGERTPLADVISAIV